MKKECMDLSLTKCFWCGEDIGIVIGEKLIDCKDKYRNKSIIVNYEPCDKCKEKMNKGFTVMIAQDKPISKGQPEIQKGIYPSGQ